MLSEKVAVITGGASGVGREIALTFAAYGSPVVVADIQEEPRTGGRPTHLQIQDQTNVTAEFVECDVTDTDDIYRAISAADDLGGIDVMVNNAAIAMKEDFLQTTEEEYEKIMAVNTKGVYFGSQIAAKRMMDNSGGSIINVSSIAGIRGTGDLVAYSASKGAVRVMTYALADKLGSENIRVNALHPSGIRTAMSDDIGVAGSKQETQYIENTPLNRFGTPKDVANAAVFLASDLSNFVSGSSILVDGGRTYTY
jgi:NAD(P)-dependent dehydrogenase (short-subunit alcohol dehydrogenase family)